MSARAPESSSVECYGTENIDHRPDICFLGREIELSMESILKAGNTTLSEIKLENGLLTFGLPDDQRRQTCSDCINQAQPLHCDRCQRTLPRGRWAELSLAAEDKDESLLGRTRTMAKSGLIPMETEFSMYRLGMHIAVLWNRYLRKSSLYTRESLRINHDLQKMGMRATSWTWAGIQLASECEGFSLAFAAEILKNEGFVSTSQAESWFMYFHDFAKIWQWLSPHDEIRNRHLHRMGSYFGLPKIPGSPDTFAELDDGGERLPNDPSSLSPRPAIQTGPEAASDDSHERVDEKVSRALRRAAERKVAKDRRRGKGHRNSPSSKKVARQDMKNSMERQDVDFLSLPIEQSNNQLATPHENGSNFLSHDKKNETCDIVENLGVPFIEEPMRNVIGSPATDESRTNTALGPTIQQSQGPSEIKGIADHNKTSDPTEEQHFDVKEPLAEEYLEFPDNEVVPETEVDGNGVVAEPEQSEAEQAPSGETEQPENGQTKKNVKKAQRQASKRQLDRQRKWTSERTQLSFQAKAFTPARTITRLQKDVKSTHVSGGNEGMCNELTPSLEGVFEKMAGKAVPLPGLVTDTAPGADPTTQQCQEVIPEIDQDLDDGNDAESDCYFESSKFLDHEITSQEASDTASREDQLDAHSKDAKSSRSFDIVDRSEQLKTSAARMDTSAKVVSSEDIAEGSSLGTPLTTDSATSLSYSNAQNEPVESLSWLQMGLAAEAEENSLFGRAKQLGLLGLLTDAEAETLLSIGKNTAESWQLIIKNRARKAVTDPRSHKWQWSHLQLDAEDREDSIFGAMNVMAEMGLYDAQFIRKVHFLGTAIAKRWLLASSMPDTHEDFSMRQSHPMPIARPAAISFRRTPAPTVQPHRSVRDARPPNQGAFEWQLF